MATAPSATIITPAAKGLPAILSFSGGELAVDTPLGSIHLPIEVTIVGTTVEAIREALESFVCPEPSLRAGLQDFPSWKANGRPVQTLRAVSPEAGIVDARVMAGSIPEAVAIMGALADHAAAALAS